MEQKPSRFPPPVAGDGENLEAWEPMKGSLKDDPKWIDSDPGVYVWNSYENARDMVLKRPFQTNYSQTETMGQAFTRCEPLIIGRVRIWGAAIQHELGWRAERAEVVEIEEIWGEALMWLSQGPGPPPSPVSLRNVLAGLRMEYLGPRRARKEIQENEQDD